MQCTNSRIAQHTRIYIQEFVVQPQRPACYSQLLKSLQLLVLLWMFTLKVGSALCDLATLESNVLDNDLLVVDAGDTNPSRVAGQSSLEHPHVGVLEVTSLPGLSVVAADIDSLDTVGHVLNGSSKPVLGGTTVHVDLEGSRSERALNPLPLDAIDTTCTHTVGELLPGRGGHVEMVLVASGSVGDLRSLGTVLRIVNISNHSP